MNHAKAKRNLVSYVRGDLMESELTAVREHLRQCDRCRDELASVARLHSALKQTVPAYWNCLEPVPDLAAGLVTSKLAESQHLGWLARLRSSRPWLAPAGVAAISLLLVLVVVAGVPPIRDRIANALGIEKNQGTEVTVIGRDMVLTMRLPGTDYQSGQRVVAMVEVRNSTSQTIQLSGYDGQYLNLSVEDQSGNEVFNWLKNAYGEAVSVGPTSFINLEPGASLTKSIEFTAKETGILVLRGSTFDGLLATSPVAINVTGNSGQKG